MKVERRPVPHIQVTPELEAAMIAVVQAKTAKGYPAHLGNSLDVLAVREALRGVAEWFVDATFFFEGDCEHAAELAALQHVILLATLLREHLKAGNV